MRRIRRDRHREAQETIGPQLQHDGSQHCRAAGGRLHVHIGQPRVHRPHGHLHREGGKKSKEQKRLLQTTQGHGVPIRYVKAAHHIGSWFGVNVQIDQGHQHQQRTHQGVEEKLEGRINFIGATPDTDDEIHRDQCGLKKYIKQHAIERAKHANHQAAQNQKRAHVLVDTARNRFPAGDYDNDVNERSEQYKPERNAV